METQAQASFQITEFTLTAGTLDATFTVTDEDDVLNGQEGSVYIYDKNGQPV